MTVLQSVWVVTESNRNPYEPASEQVVGVFWSQKSAKNAAMQRAQAASLGRGVRVTPELPDGSGSVGTNNGARDVWWSREEVLP